MAEALGIASSITALIDASTAVISYLKAVKDAPKERKELLKELSDLNDWLSKVVLLTTPPPFTISRIVPLTLTVSLPRPMLANDPWLATMQKLSAPFARLTELLNDLQKELGPASSGRKRLLWKFKKESVEDALKEIERIKSLMIVAVQRDHVALSHTIQEKLDSVIAKVDDVLESTHRNGEVASHVEMKVKEIGGQVGHIINGVSRIQSRVQNAQDDGLLMSIITWLTDLNFKSVQAEKLSQRVGDTGQWFLELEPFKKWVDGSATSSCLWCPGNPGVGKTILASIIVDYLRFLDHKKTTLVLSIFCDYQSAVAQTIPNLLCSLLKQLVQDHGLSDPITSLYKQCLRDQMRPSLSTLIKTLSQELGSFCCVYIVLDALDEFTDDNQEELINTTRSLGDNIHLLVTSREIPKIRLLFKNETRLDIRAATADINTFVMSKLSQGDIANLINGDDNLHEVILTGVAEKARGMFLLASLHMDSLAQSTNRKILRDALKELPDNMKNAYEKTMERIKHQGKHKSALASCIFGWIVFARRPLFALELRHALAVELGTTTLNPDNLCNKDLLESVCGGLIVIDQTRWNRNIVRFVHYTTQEYFMSQKNSLFPQFQETMARTCLTYMMFNDLDIEQKKGDNWPVSRLANSISISVDHDANNIRSFYSNSDEDTNNLVGSAWYAKYPFFSYSCEHWRYHASELPVKEIIVFLDSVCYGKVVKIFHTGIKFTKMFVPLHLAVQYNLLNITEVLLDRGDDPYQCKTPLLFTAINNGNPEMVKLLLNRDEINPNTWNSEKQWAPLSYAAKRGFTQIVKILLQVDQVDVNSKDSTGCTPLSYAVERGFTEIIEMLLQLDQIDVNCKDSTECTPLSYTVKSGSAEMVETILKWDKIDVNSKDFTGRTPLSYAAERGCTEIVKMLLQLDQIDVNSKDFTGCTPLFYAVKNGFTEMVETILKLDQVDVDCKDFTGRTLLSYAVDPVRWMSTTEIVEMLLQLDQVDVNSKDSTGCTPLFYAVKSGSTEMVETILKLDQVDVDCKDSTGRTPLSYAVDPMGWISTTEIVEMLLRLDQVDVNSKDSIGRTPLSYAVDPVGWMSTTEIVKMLLQLDQVDVDCKDSTGRTPLSYAVDPVGWMSTTEIVEMLLQLDQVDVNSKDSTGHTPLSYAVERGFTEVVEMLLQLDKVDVNCKDSTGCTPLSYAVERGFTEIVEMLLQLDQIDVNSKDSTGRTPLILAVISSNTSIIEILLKHTGVDKLARDNEDNTAYIYAYRHYQASDHKNDDDDEYEKMIDAGDNYPILSHHQGHILEILQKYGCRHQM